MHGVWEQVHLDHGTKFAIVVSAQQHLSRHRRNHTRLAKPFTLVERIWPEVKENNDEIDMGSETTKFCVSWVNSARLEFTSYTRP